jgi:hypothetical protein
LFWASRREAAAWASVVVVSVDILKVGQFVGY